MGPLERPSRREQIREAILDELAAGQWGEYLPSERELAAVFGVGRDQVHQAILRLRDEGVVELTGGRNRITESGGAGSGARREGRIRKVVVLSSYDQSDAGAHFRLIVEALFEHLLARGTRVVLENSKRLLGKRPDASLAKLVQAQGEAVWLLYRAAPSVQEWFLQRGLPCLVVGTGCGSIPCVDINHKAATRHAVTVMEQAGHSAGQVVFLRQDSDLAGLQQMEEGFLEMAGPNGSQQVVRYREGTEGNLVRRLERLPWKRAEGIGGVITSSSRCAMTVASWIPGGTGLRFGRDLSLICVADNPWLSHLHPSVAHYSLRIGRYTGPLLRMVNRMLDREDSGRNRQRLVMPEFVAGRSVRPSRERR